MHNQGCIGQPRFQHIHPYQHTLMEIDFQTEITSNRISTAFIAFTLVQMERMMNSFYCGSKKNGQSLINWMPWDKLTPHKSFGGPGFRNIEALNLSMLGKQGWKLMDDSNPLVTRILKAKYYPIRDFLEARLGHNPSYTCKSLWSTQFFLTLGHRWKVGVVLKLICGVCRGFCCLSFLKRQPLHLFTLRMLQLICS